MSQKDRLLKRLQEWDMPGGDCGENGRFPVGQQPVDYNQIQMVHDKMSDWLEQTRVLKAHIRELLAVINSAPGLRVYAPDISNAASVLDTAEHTININDLQTTINSLHRAMGGSGTPYLR